MFHIIWVKKSRISPNQSFHFEQIHSHARPYYLHGHNSPIVLHQASMLITWKGCAEIIRDRYHSKIPLTQISMSQDLDIPAQAAKRYIRRVPFPQA